MADFILATFRILIYILFFVMIIGGAIYGAVLPAMFTYGEPNPLAIVVGLFVGLLVGFLYAVLITGFGVLLLDIRRLLMSIDQKTPDKQG